MRAHHRPAKRRDARRGSRAKIGSWTYLRNKSPLLLETYLDNLIVSRNIRPIHLARQSPPAPDLLDYAGGVALECQRRVRHRRAPLVDNRTGEDKTAGPDLGHGAG